MIVLYYCVFLCIYISCFEGSKSPRHDVSSLVRVLPRTLRADDGRVVLAPRSQRWDLGSALGPCEP